MNEKGNIRIVEKAQDTRPGLSVSEASAMLSIFGRAGAILLAVIDVSHALYA